MSTAGREPQTKNLKGVEFDSFRREAGSNAFTLSPQRWIGATNAIGIVSKSWTALCSKAHSHYLLKALELPGRPPGKGRFFLFHRVRATRLSQGGDQATGSLRGFA